MKCQILKLRNEGKTYREIAKILSCSKTLVEHHCNPEKKSPLQKRWRNNRKKRLVDALGGKCRLCGYNRTVTALDFHHRNPQEKEFGIAAGMRLAYSFEKLLEEAKKCEIVCSNCHREIHDGLVDLSNSLPTGMDQNGDELTA